MKTFALILAMLGTSVAAQEAPLSVIPWLSDQYGAVTEAPAPLAPTHMGSPVETGSDRMMALHAIALALIVRKEVRWINPESYNAGKVVIRTYGNGCTEFENILLIQSTLPAHRETMTACRGGGNDNTWIINNTWVISSVDREIHGNCRVRFTDARVDRGRMTDTATICYSPENQNWTVEG